MWTKYILQKLTSANKTFTPKSSLSGQRTLYKKTYKDKIYTKKGSFGRQNIHYKISLGAQNMYRKK